MKDTIWTTEKIAALRREISDTDFYLCQCYGSDALGYYKNVSGKAHVFVNRNVLDMEQAAQIVTACPQATEGWWLKY